MHPSPRLDGKRGPSWIQTSWMLWALGWVKLGSTDTTTAVDASFEETIKARIVGGTPVEPQDKYPWMVLLGCAPPGQQARPSLYCGGTLLTPLHVLSAAHCNPKRVGCDPRDAIVVFRCENKEPYKDTNHPHRQWLLQTTRTDQTMRMHALQSTPTHENVNHSPYQRSQNAQGVLRVGVEQAIEHPSYNPATLGHDAMILKLARAVHDRTTVALPPAGERLQDRAQVQVMGWGTTAFGGPLSDLLLEVELQVTPQATCEGVYGPLREEMMCAAGPNKDACQGDSGGPLLKAGTAFQYGIVSFGVDCGIYPGVYTRTTAPNVHDWIVAIARLSTHPSTPPPMGSPPEPHPPTPPPALDPPAMPPTIVFPPFDHAGRRLPSPGIRARWLVAWFCLLRLWRRFP